MRGLTPIEREVLVHCRRPAGERPYLPNAASAEVQAACWALYGRGLLGVGAIDDDGARLGSTTALGELALRPDAAARGGSP